MHLVGYLYEDYHDARSLEHKENKFVKMGWVQNFKINFKTTYTPYNPRSQFLKFCNVPVHLHFASCKHQSDI